MDQFKKKLLTESVITLAILLTLFAGISFLSSRVTEYSDQISAKRNQLTKQAKDLGSLASLQTQYSGEVGKYLQSMKAAVPIKDQLINLSKEFQLISSKNGLSSSFSFLSESPASGTYFGNMKFKLEVNGNFEKLIEFVSELQNFRYFSTFDSFSIVRTSEGNGQLTTHGQVFFRQE
ncbi:MAG: type 4a pilus biogenesis protein PilO [bacterium]|nr:type 4a pilus biogenesis protein PilO [Candidatus Jorgensenbacteria bacterium]